jgi:tetratricopeptide (TPR) repeat protein
LGERADEAIAKYAQVSEAQEPVKPPERKRALGDLAEAGELFELARVRYEEREYERAETLLIRSLEMDASNPNVYVLLAMSVGMQAEHGYDERIGEDRNLRANMAFRTIDYLDEAAKLAPDDPEIRLMRGVLGVELPFFVRRLEQGVEDLEWVTQSSAHDTIKAEALYYLGVAHRKKTLSHWAAAVRDYPDSRAASQVLASLRPTEEGIDPSEYERPVLVVEFLLGFQEELPPQTAVWVEDDEGNPVKTLFISGYAGHVGAKEITLPKWGSSTDFETDATTGASIDLGHHVYTWDLTNRTGDRVSGGEYTVWVEVSYWPSMQYDLVSATFPLTSEASSVRVEDGRLIPLLEVICLP